MKLSVDIAGLTWKNPVTVASGTFGSGREYAQYVDINRLGAITTKGVAPIPWAGNRTPRVAESYGGMLNSIGLQNPGVEQFIANDMDFFRQIEPLVIVNVCGHKIADYCAVARRLSQEDANGVDMLEINISCPNVAEGGIQFGTNWKMTEKVVREVKKVTHLPLIIKLTPNVSDIEVIAKAAEGAGADALSMVNTLLAMRIDINRRRPMLGNVFGGLSGPAIKPVALRCVYQVAHCVKIPIIGMGGIICADDAIEFIMAGASAVAVGTANFANPRASLDVLEGIEDFMEKNGINDINEIIGAAL